MKKIILLLLLSVSAIAQRKIEQRKIENLADSLAKKVDKVAGKYLSTNDYTTTEKNKLSEINTASLALLGSPNIFSNQNYFQDVLNLGESNKEALLRWRGNSGITEKTLWETGIDVANSPTYHDFVIAAKKNSDGSVADVMYYKYNGNNQPVLTIPVDASETTSTLKLSIWGNMLNYDNLKIAMRTGQIGKGLRIVDETAKDIMSVDVNGLITAPNLLLNKTNQSPRITLNDLTSSGYDPRIIFQARNANYWTIGMDASQNYKIADSGGNPRMFIEQGGRVTFGNSSATGNAAVHAGLFAIGGTFFINGNRDLININTITNNSSSNSKAILDLTSTTKGVLLPRMTTTERNAISSPPEGLKIYNITTHTEDYFNGTAWKTTLTN